MGKSPLRSPQAHADTAPNYGTLRMSTKNNRAAFVGQILTQPGDDSVHCPFQHALKVMTQQWSVFGLRQFHRYLNRPIDEQ